MPRLSIHLFGPFRVLLDDDPVTAFESSKVRALLAYLACEAQYPHSRDELIGLLWPEQDDRSARRNLSQALFNLRQTIGDSPEAHFLEISRETIQFNPESDFWLDVRAFVKHLAACPLEPASLLTDAEGHIPALEQAEALYLGEFLSGFFVGDNIPFSEWITLQREQYHCQALEVQRRLAQLYEQRRDYARACHYTRRQVELEPWREEAHQSLMRLLARSGQRSAALRQYELCRRALLDELGIAPQPATYALYERIRMAGDSVRHNLPEPQTPLVGRGALLAQVTSQMAEPDCRLLTLLGPGGIGKTRLAWQAARDLLDIFMNGVWYIPLAAADSTAGLISVFADALGIQFSGGRSTKDQLLGYLKSRDLLLVLDGAEHLLEPRPCGSVPQEPGPLNFLLEILHTAPLVKLLVTSRQRLNLQAEWLVDVPGLSYPAEEQAASPADYEAVQLFARHARRARADFMLTSENQAQITRICQTLDGAPLGIELAAPWVRALSCAEIAERVQADLDFLVTSLHDVPVGHQSLRAVFAQSWNLLTDTERRAAARLSVFRLSFDHRAALAVAGVEAGVALELAKKSILSQDQSGRYVFHALLKQYMAEMLAQSLPEQQQARQAHCDYYAAFLQQRRGNLRGGGQKQAQTEIRTELDEIRTAWDWAVTQGCLDFFESATESLFLFYRGLGRYQEGLGLFQQAGGAIQPVDESTGLLLARLLVYQADFHGWLGSFGEARALLQQGLPVLQAQGRPSDAAFGLLVAGLVAYWDGQYGEAQNLLEESAAVYQQVGDAWGTAMALNYLANASGTAANDWGDVVTLYEESLHLSEQIGDQAGAARALINLGAIEHAHKDYARAQELYARAAAYSREIESRQLLATTLGNLGDVLCRSKEYARAIDLLQESLSIKRELGNRPSIILTMNYLGQAYLHQKEYPEARRWYLQALDLARQVGSEVYIACMLVSLAGWLVHAGEDYARAAELLQVGLDYACGDQEIIASVEKYWPILQQHLSAADLAACRQRAHTRRLEDVVTELLAGA